MWNPFDITLGNTVDPKANFPTLGGYEHRNILFSVSYDGEKNPGQIGTIKKYYPNYRALRNRGWQAFLDSEVVQALIKKHTKWNVGKGLRLQAKPMEEILASEGASIDRPTWVRNVEQRWKIFGQMKSTSYDNQMTLHGLAKECQKNTLTAGDMLVILRVIDEQLTVQLVDADHIYTPWTGQKEQVAAVERGNTIRDGVELDERDRHVAYYVRTSQTRFERIPAKDDDGMLQAWLVYGSRYRQNSVRGIPIVSAVLETVAKLDRYKEAAVSGAEQRAKLAYFIEHGPESNEENPLTDQIKQSLSLNSTIEGAKDDSYTAGVRTAANITSMTDSLAINMPKGSTINSVSSDMEMSFKEFYMTVLNVVATAVEIPLEVLLSKYDSNFSASRAALKEWEHTLVDARAYFSEQFYKPIYQYWLYIEDLKNKVRSPRLLNAVEAQNETVIEAYSNARWIGSNVPHIDPVKEAKAEREKLGPEGAHVPLTTPSQAAEALGEGDYEEIAEQFIEEIELVPKTEPVVPTTGEGGGEGEGESDD